MEGKEVVVRRKASMRKARAENSERTARLPTQQRSIQRFELILEAAEQLLQTSNIEDISFYDIADQAGISPASVNYFFPTMSAICIELNKRYLRSSTDDFLEMMRELAARRDPSWQNWLLELAKRVREHSNANRHICEVVMGPSLSRDASRATILSNDEFADCLLQSLQEVFVMPEIPGLLEKFGLAVEIADALLSRSYILHGTVNEETPIEIARIQAAYLRLFLPEMLPLRAERTEDVAET